MKLRPADLPAHLDKTLAALYALAGDEPLLVQEAQDAIRAAARRRGYAERQILDAERGFDWQALVEACNTRSLFAEQRLIELRLGSGMPGVEGTPVLKQVAADLAPDVVLLVIGGALDWKQRSGGWFAALEAAGVSVYAEPVVVAELPGWLRQRLQRAGLTIEDEALDQLVHRTEGNLLAAAQEVEKLALLHPGARLTLEQVEQAVADSARFEAFDLVERVLRGDTRGALRSLSGLRQEGVEPPELVPPLAYALRQWISLQQLYQQTGDVEAALTQARLFGPRQAPYRRALPRARLPQLYGWLRQLQRVDGLGKSTLGREQAWEELLSLAQAASGSR
ncbi:MAG TPA: DNA polymerase III subunit delta [Nevskiaceae bacterium]|nr:DNA polymerase III subunit delta [Nevskiaceae bacterium]